MTLVQRYLNAVRFFLPRRLQDDIGRELSENLASEIEDRTEVLGRDLSDDEVADILRRHGHPALVAARYAPRQQLIGPVFFPLYALALKVGLAAALAVTIVLALVGAALRGASVQHFLDTLLEYPGRALTVFAWTTLAFAVLDALGARSQVKPDWDPRKIPDWMAGARQQDRLQDRLQGGFEVLFGFAAVVWLALVPTWPWLALGPLASALEFAPVWRTWYVPLVLVSAANLAIDTYRLLRRPVTSAHLRAKLVGSTALLAVMLLLLGGGEWVVARDVAAAGASQPPIHEPAAVARALNVALGIGFTVVVILTLVDIGKYMYRLRTFGNALVSRENH